MEHVRLFRPENEPSQIAWNIHDTVTVFDVSALYASNKNCILSAGVNCLKPFKKVNDKRNWISMNKANIFTLSEHFFCGLKNLFNLLHINFLLD